MPFLPFATCRELGHVRQEYEKSEDTQAIYGKSTIPKYAMCRSGAVERKGHRPDDLANKPKSKIKKKKRRKMRRKHRNRPRKRGVTESDDFPPIDD